MTYFVSAAGEIMQRLALQATQAGKRRIVSAPSAAPPAKKIKMEDTRDPLAKKIKLEDARDLDETKQAVEHVKQEVAATDATPGMKHDDVELLPDVISLEDDGHDIGAEQRAYEMRRMWDAGEQMPWSRSCRILLGVEELLNTTKHISTAHALTYYESSRMLNDELAQESITLTETPLASVLLHINSSPDEE
jgi:hypothetical protein